MREFSCEWWKIIDAARLFRVHPATVSRAVAKARKDQAQPGLA